MKLVRDKIAERHPQHEYQYARSWELETLLRLKLAEEAGEVIAARNEDELLEEIADLMEIVERLAVEHGWSLQGAVRAARDAKRTRLGGFSEGLVLVDYKAE